MNKRKTAIVTGASKGLGRAIATEFAKNRYDLILSARNNAELTSLKKELADFGANCILIDGDIREDCVQNRIYDASKAKNLKVMVNNAAAQCPHLPLEDLSLATIDEVLSTTLSVPIALTRKIYPILIDRGGGAIININSISGLESQKLRSVYCAAKWGLRGFTESMRAESSDKNIRILGVYPSRIKTKPEFEYGIEVKDAAKRIYYFYAEGKAQDLIMDERPKEFRRAR